MSAALLLQVLVNGLLQGGLYALMALGLALVWGVLNIVNLAHGALIMLGGYVTWVLWQRAGWDPFAALPVAAAALFVLGYALQRGVLNLVMRGPMFNTLLITFGLEVVITYLAQIVFTADLRTINPGYSGRSVAMAGVTVPLVRVAAFALAVALTLAMWQFLLHTRAGRRIRATAQNLTAARLHGVEPRHLYATTFAIGAAFAGVAGGLYGIVSQLNPYIGATLTAKCFAISIIGGLESPLGVLVGGLLLGVVEAFASLWPGSTYVDAVSFGLLVVVLVTRPTGLLGRTA